MAPPLLASDEPLPFRVLNPDGGSPVLFLCDHASRFIPRAFGGDLGVGEADLARHIAYDIGAEEVTERLSDALDATAVISRFSRLLIDPNRRPDIPSSIPAESDGTRIPANQDLDEAARQARIETFFLPYHRAVNRSIEARIAKGQPTVLVSMHSFTPVWQGFERPWHIGILWNQQPELPLPLMEAFAAEGMTVGDNEPYTGRDYHGYTMHRHAEERGLANALVEMRQDLIDTHSGVAKMAETCRRALARALAAPSMQAVLEGEGERHHAA